MNKNVFLSVAAALMLAACSNDDQLPPEETPIRLSAGLDVAAGTRGITDNSYNATVFNGGETIDVNIVETGSPATPSVTYGPDGWLTATIGASGNGATLSSACYWPGSGAGIDIYAWYPVSTATTYWTNAHSVFKVPATQSGNTDHKAFEVRARTHRRCPPPAALLPSTCSSLISWPSSWSRWLPRMPVLVSPLTT